MRRLALLPVAALVVAGGVLAGRPVVSAQDAQEPVVAAPMPIGMTFERYMALSEAFATGLDYVPGEVLIKFRAGVTTVGQTRALSGLRSRPSAAALRWTGNIALLRDAGESDARILARQLQLQPEVEYAEPNYIYQPHSTPNDPSFSARQWHMTQIDMPRAWDIQSAPGRDVTVAVIDTGVTNVTQNVVFPTWTGSAIQNVAVPYAVNPDLPAARLKPGRDFVFLTAGQPVLDMVGHGTHVASTIAEEANNSLFGVGVAYNASIMPLKVCIGYWELQFVRSAFGIPGFEPPSNGGCFTDGIVSAIRFAADNGANVINMSLGGSGESQAQREAIVYAVSRGVFVAASMGNNFEQGNTRNFPASFAKDINGFVSVASTNRSNGRSYFSATGDYTEIAAPGGDLRDGGTAGQVWQSTMRGSDFDISTVIFPVFNVYQDTPFQGTSMASPHVAGVAALLYRQGITDPAAIEAIIKKTAKDLGAPGRDDLFGFGLVQPRTALFGRGVGK